MGTYGKMYSKLQELIKAGMNLDDAANQVLHEYEGRGPAPTVVRNVGQRQTRVVEPNPTGRQLQRTLNEILPPIQDMAQQTGNTYRSTLTQRQMERRYQYSKRCRNVMMKIIKEDIQRYQKFVDTAKDLFGENPYDQNVPQGQKPPTVNMGRWMQQLMRLDGSEAARYHNEEVVSLAMLCESATYENLQAGRQKFRAARYKHYTENLHQTEEEANRHADEDLNKGAKRLAELTLDMLSRQCCTPEEADQALDAILTGSAERNGPDGLERAYRTIMSPANAVSWNISNTRNDLNRYGAGISEEEYRQRYHPFEMKSVASHGAVAALVANPYYAVLDSGKLADALATQLQCREGENNRNSPLVDFGADATGGMMGLQMDYQNRNLTRFNFTRGNVTQLWQRPEYVSVYTSGNRSLILVGKPRNLDQGLSTSFEWNKPGRLINGNFAKIVSDMKAAVEKKDQFLRSSPEYRAMKRALNDVSKVKIPDSGNDAKLRELGRKLETLRAAANAYIEKKNREFAERGAPRGQNGKNPYERQRYVAAASMGGFIDEMENRIMHIRRHQSTVTQTFEQERLAAEMRAEQQNAQQVQQAPQAEQNLQHAQQNVAQQNVVQQPVQQAPQPAQQAQQPVKKNDGQMNVQKGVPEEEEEEIRLDPPKEGRIKADEYKKLKNKNKKAEKREEDKKEENKKKVEEKENPNRINIVGENNKAPANGKPDYDSAQKTAETRANQNIQAYNTMMAEYAKLKKSGSDPAVLQSKEQKLREYAKSAIAGYIISELVSNREKRLADEKAPITQLVNSGKMDGLANQIIESGQFDGSFGKDLENIDACGKLLGSLQENPKSQERKQCYSAGMTFLFVKSAEFSDNKYKKKVNSIFSAGPDAEELKLMSQKNGNSWIEPAVFNDIIREILESAHLYKREYSADKLLKDGIATAVEKYDRRKNQDDFASEGILTYYMSEALCDATLKYMMDHEKDSQCLKDAIERGKLDSLRQSIGEKTIFKEKLKGLDWNDPDQWKKCLTDNALFCAPVGETLLRMAGESLRKQGREDAAKEEKSQLKSEYNDNLCRSVNAAEAGDRKTAEEQGTQALAKAVAYAAYGRAGGKAASPFELYNAICEKPFFYDEVGKLNLMQKDTIENAVNGVCNELAEKLIRTINSEKKQGQEKKEAAPGQNGEHPPKQNKQNVL